MRLVPTGQQSARRPRVPSGPQWDPRAYSGQQGCGVPEGMEGPLGPTVGSQGLWRSTEVGGPLGPRDNEGWEWLGPLRPTTGENGPLGSLGPTLGPSQAYSGRQWPLCPLRPNCSGAQVTRAVGADDAGEPLEGTDDLAASPRLEILHEQQLKAPHGRSPCLSRVLVRWWEKRGKSFAKSRETSEPASQPAWAPFLSNESWRFPGESDPCAAAGCGWRCFSGLQLARLCRLFFFFFLPCLF